MVKLHSIFSSIVFSRDNLLLQCFNKKFIPGKIQQKVCLFIQKFLTSLWNLRSLFKWQRSFPLKNHTIYILANFSHSEDDFYKLQRTAKVNFYPFLSMTKSEILYLPCRQFADSNFQILSFSISIPVRFRYKILSKTISF